MFAAPVVVVVVVVVVLVVVVVVVVVLLLLEKNSKTNRHNSTARCSKTLGYWTSIEPLFAKERFPYFAQDRKQKGLKVTRVAGQLGRHESWIGTIVEKTPLV